MHKKLAVIQLLDLIGNLVPIAQAGCEIILTCEMGVEVAPAVLEQKSVVKFSINI